MGKRVLKINVAQAYMQMFYKTKIKPVVDARYAKAKEESVLTGKTARPRIGIQQETATEMYNAEPEDVKKAVEERTKVQPVDFTNLPKNLEAARPYLTDEEVAIYLRNHQYEE